MTKLPALYQLESQWDEVMALAESEPDLELADTIEGLTGTLDEKRQACGHVLKNWQALAAARKAAAKEMLESAKTIERQHDRLKDYLARSMTKHSISRIDCPEFSIYLRQNPPKVVIDDESQVPLKYQEEVMTWKISRKHIKAAIEAGENIEWARLERGWRVDIK